MPTYGSAAVVQLGGIRHGIRDLAPRKEGSDSALQGTGTVFRRAGQRCPGALTFTPPRFEDILPAISWAEIRAFLPFKGKTVDPMERILLAILNADQPPGLLISGTDLSVGSWSARLQRQCQRFVKSRESRLSDSSTCRSSSNRRSRSPGTSVATGPSRIHGLSEHRLAPCLWGEPSSFRYRPERSLAAHDVGTGEEFYAAMSAVGDAISNLQVINEPGSHPCDRLEARRQGPFRPIHGQGSRRRRRSTSCSQDPAHRSAQHGWEWDAWSLDES